VAPTTNLVDENCYLSKELKVQKIHSESMSEREIRRDGYECSYFELVKEACPNAKIGIDRFFVISCGFLLWTVVDEPYTKMRFVFFLCNIL